jgi:cyclase
MGKRTVKQASIMAALAMLGGMTTSTVRLSAQQEAMPLEILELRSNFYMIVGAGGNIGVQIGPDGPVVVDAGTGNQADSVVAAIKRLTPEPIRYVIDTSARPDHTGGNEKIAKAGETLFFLNNPTNVSMTNGGAAAIVATDNALARMSALGSGAMPLAAQPTEPFQERLKHLYFNGEGIAVMRQPAAITDGDVIVFFRRSDVVVTGDIFDVDRFPTIDTAQGGTIQGEIGALNKLVDLAISSVPMAWRDDGTLIVPGHGRICDQADLVEYRDMVAIIRDRVRALIKEGKTLDQVEAAAPAAGYLRRYGHDRGPWSTNAFIESIYKSLQETSK